MKAQSDWHAKYAFTKFLSQMICYKPVIQTSSLSDLESSAAKRQVLWNQMVDLNWIIQGEKGLAAVNFVFTGDLKDKSKSNFIKIFLQHKHIVPA